MSLSGRPRMRHGLILLLGMAAWSNNAPAAGSGSDSIDRSQYNLLHPEPGGNLRDFMPDRPNLTNGPYTVDPGHWLVEVGLFEYTRDRWDDDHTRKDIFAFADSDIRLGLTGNVEVDAIFTAFTYQRTKDKLSGDRQRKSGFSDLNLRAKWNLWGNDNGNWSIGLIPGFTLPTAQNGLGDRGVEGEIGFPIQVKLPGDWGFSFESTVRTLHTPGAGSNFDFLNSATLAHDLFLKLSTYVELASDVTTQAHNGWAGVFDTGLIWQPIENWQFDGGVRFGLTKAADNLFPFVGFAWRY